MKNIVLPLAWIVLMVGMLVAYGNFVLKSQRVAAGGTPAEVANGDTSTNGPSLASILH